LRHGNCHVAYHFVHNTYLLKAYGRQGSVVAINKMEVAMEPPMGGSSYFKAYSTASQDVV